MSLKPKRSIVLICCESTPFISCFVLFYRKRPQGASDGSGREEEASCSRCGNVEIALSAISKGCGNVGNRSLVFHVPIVRHFHGASVSDIPAMLLHLVLRQRANNASFAFCIRCAASVSFIFSASRFNICSMIASFRCFCQSVNEVSFS